MVNVSIIIPNYNHATYLKQRIDSVLNQTYQDFEVIILDDCSTDNSREVIESYRNHPKVSQIIFNEQNSGSTFKQWEKGIQLACGEYIWMAESDDYADENFLEKAVQVLKRNPKTGIVFCGSYWIDDKNKVCEDLSLYQNDFLLNGKDEIKRAMVKYNSIQNVSSVLFRSEKLKSVSKKYVKYKSSGDWILYTELLINCDVCYVSEKLNYFRFYHNNISNKASGKGLWSYEGVDILLLVRSKVDFTNEELKDILAAWKNRIFPLRKSVAFSIRMYFIIHWKLFLFSPANYLKTFWL